MTSKLQLLILSIGFSFPLTTFGQLVINEFCSKGSIKDFDGKTNDWIELVNTSSSTINLSNYFISDKINNLSKWNFPNVNLQSMDKILVLCSGFDRKERVIHWESIVNENTFFKYFLGTQEPDSNWNSDINDSSWLIGLNGIGFGDNDDSTIIANTSSLYLRHTFHINNKDEIVKLLLHADYDDSFVAYLNGIEIARSNNIYGNPITHQTLATSPHEASINTGEEFDRFLISKLQLDTLLKIGVNQLAVQVHDCNSIPDDMSARFFLHLGLHSDTIFYSDPCLWLNENKVYYHTNFKLSSGEDIIVSDINGNIVDQKTINSSNTFISEGRFPDGIGGWCYFSPSTPGFTNDSSNCFNGITPNPTISVNSGWYSSEQHITISSSINTQVFYTTNGDVPDTNDYLYTDTLSFDSTTILSVRAFNTNHLPSKVVDRTYIINEDNHDLPVFSIVTDSSNLWDWDTGIYVLGPGASSSSPFWGANFHKPWSKWSRIEFFDANQLKQYDGELDLEIHGGYSRKFDQKSFRLDFKSIYTGDLDYPVISQKPNITKYNNINLRNGGNENSSNRIKDAIFSTLAQKTNIDIMGYQPCILYLNGAYWGIYGIREKIDEHYIEANYNITSDNLDLIGAKEKVLHGDKNSFIEAYHLLLNTDPDDIMFLTLFKDIFDINNYIDYYVFETIIQNKDWYAGKYNSKLWRDKSNGGKWRFVLYDTDQAYRDPPQQNFILEKTRIPINNNYSVRSRYSQIFDLAMKNREFQCLFWNRYNTMLNDVLHIDSVRSVTNNLKNQIINAMPEHLNRWQNNISLNTWQDYVDNITNSHQSRVPYALSQVSDMIESNLNYVIFQDIINGSINIDLNQGNLLAYEWFYNGNTILSAYDSIYYPLDDGYYYCLVTDSFGCKSFSDTIFAKKCGGIALLTQDSINNSLHITGGGNPPYSYQWFIDSVPLKNTDRASLDIYDFGTYYAIVEDINGCISFTDTINNKKMEVNAFPNPTNSRINLQFTRLYGEKYTISVFDLSMKLIQHIKLPQINYSTLYTYSFNLDINKSGLYFIKLESSNSQISKKIIYLE
ncbi:MAG: hypothetical protein CMP69_02115 [Flavobacteriales bacterium]|nr:hypothetical protein [Flavobacteriales bacterium]|tara:strand:- start:318 stop:3515 length:3198 start_codon:yes stop_codon:yes gene_type:complete